MFGTGLFDLLKNHVISNLQDYITDVEAGLDYNRRKNRDGHQLQKINISILHSYG